MVRSEHGKKEIVHMPQLYQYMPKSIEKNIYSKMKIIKKINIIFKLIN